jgi:hypothetical protein
MNIVVTVEVTVEAGAGWNERVLDALYGVGSEIYTNPQYAAQKGDGTDYVFEYTVKGE